MTNASLSRHLRVALCAMLVILVAALVFAPAGMAKSPKSTATGRSTAMPTGLSISSSSFGKLPATVPANGGAPVTKYTLTNGRGMSVSILDYGGIIQSLSVPDRRGHETNVTLGFADIAGYTSAAYVKSNPYFGAIIGRYGNRIGPVGGEARQPPGFVLDGNTYTLDANNGVASLHGGNMGFDKRMWDATQIPANGNTVGLKLHRLSPDRRRAAPTPTTCTGYPGDVDVTVTFTLDNRNNLRFDYAATTTRRRSSTSPTTPTGTWPVRARGRSTTTCSSSTRPRTRPVDVNLIPTGDDPAGRGHAVRLHAVPHDRRAAARQRPAARVRARLRPQLGAQPAQRAREGPPPRRRWLEAQPEPGRAARRPVQRAGADDHRPTEPGIQFYSGNFLDGTLYGTSGRQYRQGDGLALETQHFPDSPNKRQLPLDRSRPGHAVRDHHRLQLLDGRRPQAPLAIDARRPRPRAGAVARPRSVRA